jgi:N-acetylglucosaminyldiphosphoundecaprenol N-acetyl-beta-D-mannosaminyltransferase
MVKCNVLGIDYNNVTIGQAAGEIYALVCSSKGGYVVTPNAEIAESCFKNAALKEAVNKADYVLPDGAGGVMASKICGNPLTGRAAGFDVAKALLGLMSDGGKRLFLLGAKPGTGEKAAEKIARQYPGVVIAGIHHGYFKDDSEVLDEINAVRSDVLFVALGSPRQEFFMQRNREKTSALMLGIGGSLDVFAGEARRAPDFFINRNLEWLYRLMCQPSRIGRMMKLPAYILRAGAWRLTGRARG